MHRVLPVIALTLAAGLLAGCGTDRAAERDGTAAPTTSPSTAAAPTTSPTPAETALETQPPPPAGTVIEVSFAGGQVSGDTGRVKVALGDGVTIKVTSDVAEEVHVHGYDLTQQVAAGETATLTFDATIPGVFEVELERVHKQLLSLQVQ
jgi:hypothetical protein